MSRHGDRKAGRVGRARAATVTRKHSANKQIRGATPPSTHALAKTEPAPLEGEVISAPRIPKRLDTVAEWQREIARVYRAMRKGRMPKEDGTKLVWVADIGAKLAKYQEELKELQTLRQQLEALRPGQLPALPMLDTAVDTTP